MATSTSCSDAGERVYIMPNEIRSLWCVGSSFEYDRCFASTPLLSKTNAAAFAEFTVLPSGMTKSCK